MFEIARVHLSNVSADLIVVINIPAHFVNVLMRKVLGPQKLRIVKQTQTRKQKTDRIDLVVQKTGSFYKNTILLRTSAVKVLNPESGAVAVVCAQQDIGSQVTLISTSLKEELESTPDPLVNIRTLADKKFASGDKTDCKLESRHSGER